MVGVVTVTDVSTTLPNCMTIALQRQVVVDRCGRAVPSDLGFLW